MRISSCVSFYQVLLICSTLSISHGVGVRGVKREVRRAQFNRMSVGNQTGSRGELP